MGNQQSTSTDELCGRDNLIQVILLEVGDEKSLLTEQERIEKLKIILETETRQQTSGEKVEFIIPNLDDYCYLFEQIIAYASGRNKTELLNYVLLKYPIVDVSSQDNYCFKNEYTSDSCKLILAKHETFRPDIECLRIAKNKNTELLEAALNTSNVEPDLLPHIKALRESYKNGNFNDVFNQISSTNCRDNLETEVDTTTSVSKILNEEESSTQSETQAVTSVTQDETQKANRAEEDQIENTNENTNVIQNDNQNENTNVIQNENTNENTNVIQNDNQNENINENQNENTIENINENQNDEVTLDETQKAHRAIEDSTQNETQEVTANYDSFKNDEQLELLLKNSFGKEIQSDHLDKPNFN